ncbi:PIR Superfamily Protein [Plasmodium ovale wallikeri]|uniref:PIR Superfamily Protein n=1 Tax=Plasmodium ovale wallikeri TaxID=864142 RepID=A0A1A9AKY6_PLAOA|nr:PIR Superfamily Protein [Plasmodium ovale wallikeri]SBT57286.1 PIR Superfamily Protein [Plasmodium ovale wallikeri]
MDEYDYSIVSNFPIYRTLFDNVAKDNGNYYHPYCDDAIKNYPNDPTYFRKTCLFFLKGLMYLYNNKGFHTSKEKSNSSHHEHCEYLIYMLHYELENVIKYPKNASKFYSNLKSKVKEMFTKLNICKKEIKDNDINVLKNVYVLYKIHDNLNKLMYNFSNKEMYPCSYVEKYVALYNENIVPCSFNKSTSFCDALIKLGEYYNKYILHKHKCDKLKDYMLYTGLEYPRIDTSKEKTVKAAQVESAKTDETSIKPVNIQIQSEQEELRITPNATNMPIDYKNLTGFSFLLMIIPALFSFFKFTPFGSLLHSSVNKYLGLSGNTDEQSQNILSHNLQGVETAAHNSEYRIPYNLLF